MLVLDGLQEMATANVGSMHMLIQPYTTNTTIYAHALFLSPMTYLCQLSLFSNENSNLQNQVKH